MSKLSILVIEDSPLHRKHLAAELKGHDVDHAADAKEARRKLTEREYDLAFIDLDLGPDGELAGLDLIPVANVHGAYAVVMSSYSSEKIVDRAYLLGCRDFYAKGNEKANIREILTRYMERRAMTEDQQLFSDRFFTEDPELQGAVREFMRYAASELPLLLLGPTGTGKTILGRLIHERSRRQGEFVSINCGVGTEEMLEVELFGYRKGAFTDAKENRKGKLLLASGGTLFLDELENMPLGMQAKLLKAIEERSYYPLGAEEPETSNFRIVCASLEDPDALVKAGRLRLDFFQRIKGPTIKLKPLSQRRGDVMALVSHFTQGKRQLSFTPEAKNLLLKHSWPGNVRELRTVIGLLVEGGEGRIDERILAQHLNLAATSDEVVSDELFSYAMTHGLPKALEKVADEVISRAMIANNGKKTYVMSDLHISTRMLYASLKRTPEKKG